MTLWGNASPRLGLGLWNNLTLALLVEMAIALAGLALFLSRVKLSPARRLAVIAMTMIVAAPHLYGHAVAGAAAGRRPARHHLADRDRAAGDSVGLGGPGALI